MIKWAGTGVAVESAMSTIKQEADLLAPLPEADGVATIVEEYLLSEGGNRL